MDIRYLMGSAKNAFLPVRNAQDLRMMIVLSVVKRDLDMLSCILLPLVCAPAKLAVKLMC